MTTFEILGSQLSAEIADITENLNVLFSTSVGTVPFDRDFGLDMSFLDQPLEKAKALLMVEYLKKIKKYEPRIKLQKVIFTSDPLNGQLQAKVVVEYVGSA